MGDMNVLILFHECSFKHTEVAWLVKPDVKGTASIPNSRGNWDPEQALHTVGVAGMSVKQ